MRRRSTLTPFGSALGMYRMRHGILLYDMARVLGMKSAYLSGVEWGRHTVPNNLLERICKAYPLTPEEHQELQGALNITKK